MTPPTDPPSGGRRPSLTIPPAWFGYLVGAWFVALSVMRLNVLSSATPGFDGRLYRTATLVWLDGGDPWSVYGGAIRFAAPPPSLLAMVPFTVVPADVAVALIIGLGLVGTAWAIRRLGLPLWWLAFPPFIDGLYNANPHILLVPLLVAGVAPVAVLVKVYAGLVPLVLGQWRALLGCVVVLLVTAPFLPWARYIAEWPSLTQTLADQSDGGMSAIANPILIPVAVVALLVMGRKRASWWIVPVLWPSTQWYYASLVMPGATLVSAAVVAMPVPWATTLGAALVAGEVVISRRGVAWGSVRLPPQPSSEARCYPRPDDHPDPRSGACLSGTGPRRRRYRRERGDRNDRPPRRGAGIR